MGDLKTKLVTSINQAMKHFPRPGWVRYDQLQKEIATNADLQKRIEELERQLTKAREEKFTAEDIDKIFSDNKSLAYKKGLQKSCRDCPKYFGLQHCNRRRI